MSTLVSSAIPPAADDDPRAAVVNKALPRAAELLGLSNAALCRTIGVSSATGSRLRAGAPKLQPDTKPYEMALLVIRLYRGLAGVTGGDVEAIRSWMTTENHALRGRPCELIEKVTGLVAAVDYVDAIRARI